MGTNGKMVSHEIFSDNINFPLGAEIGWSTNGNH